MVRVKWTAAGYLISVAERKGIDPVRVLRWPEADEMLILFFDHKLSGFLRRVAQDFSEAALDQGDQTVFIGCSVCGIEAA